MSHCTPTYSFTKKRVSDFMMRPVEEMQSHEATEIVEESNRKMSQSQGSVSRKGPN